MQTSQVFIDQKTAMGRQSIPNNQQVAAHIAEQVLQKQDYLLTANGFFENLEVEVPQRDAGDHRQSLPVEVMLQDRRLPAGSPCAATMRPLAQSAFVEAEDRAALLFGFFLRAGHRFFFQSSTAASFRSTARPTGSCGLQLSCRRIFQT